MFKIYAEAIESHTTHCTIAHMEQSLVWKNELNHLNNDDCKHNG